MILNKRLSGLIKYFIDAIKQATAPEPIVPRRVLIFTGAGISEESGIPTFRGANGLWNGRDIKEVCSVHGFAINPNGVNEFYDERRSALRDNLPNSAHHMIAGLSKRYPDHIDVFTQNIDDLFEKAGCDTVVHLHGTLTDLRCMECAHIFTVGYHSINEIKCCPKCQSPSLRHNVVMFGEKAPNYALLNNSTSTCQLLIAIGTSGNVIDISRATHLFEYSILCNLDPNPSFDAHFDEVYHMKATMSVTEIEEKVVSFLETGKILFRAKREAKA